MHAQKKIIEDIAKELNSAQGTWIAQSYQNALRLISQVVFTRSTGFILEFIQNAEDAGQGLSTRGVFQIMLNRQRLKIVHNGSPFNETNVRSICGIQSSKRPEQGTLGYLGIGFKSVFKVTSCPQIYSNGFQFRFDKSHWPNPADSLWRVLPVWVDSPPEPVELDKTTFIIPLEKESFYAHLQEGVKNLGTRLYLFLRWLKRIDIEDEVSGEKWTLENLGEDEQGITTLRRDGETQRFKFFRATVKVPQYVQEDDLTHEYRANVQEREIAVAFSLDTGRNLCSSEAGAMYGGVYSFLPLGEASSGAKFPIQADFLVQPGRDAINCEVQWNHWLVEEIEKLCRAAIETFKADDRWKFQYLPVFATDFSSSDAYTQLFLPKLLRPLAEYLEGHASVPTESGGWAKPSEVVRLTEPDAAAKALTDMGVLEKEEIASVLGGEVGLHLVHPAVLNGEIRIREVNRDDLLKNKEFLLSKAKLQDAAAWFQKLYLWLDLFPEFKEEKYRKTVSKTRVGHHTKEMVLTADGNLLPGGKVSFMDESSSDPVILGFAQELAQSRPMLHPELLSGCASDTEREKLKGFLTGYTGLQPLNARKVCLEGILPKIVTGASKLSADELVKYTQYCHQFLGSELPYGTELWVLAKDGEIRPARETLLASEYAPQVNWELNKKYIAGLNFVSSRYIHDNSPAQLQGWREFFRKGGVKESPDAGVEEFAVSFVEEYLMPLCKRISQVAKLKQGYDVEAETNSGRLMRIEVKGRTSEVPIDLEDNEKKAAQQHKDDFYLFIVCPIPVNPAIYGVKNPAAVAQPEKLTVPVSEWKPRKLTGNLP